MSSDDQTYETIAITAGLFLLLASAVWLILAVGKRVEDGWLKYMASKPASAVVIHRPQPVDALQAVAPNSAAGASHDTLMDRFGKSITVPKAVPGSGYSPEQKLHGHWILVSDAFTDDKSGQTLVNGPWPMAEAHHVYIDSKGGKKTMVEIYDSGSIEEYNFGVVSQNAKTGVIKIDRWYARDDEKPVPQRGAAKREYTLKSDGTMSYEQNRFGIMHTVTLRRIGDEIAP